MNVTHGAARAALFSIAVWGLGAAGALSCSSSRATVGAPAAPRPSGAPGATSLAAVGLDASALDRSADPCDDFYQFACGGWLGRTAIPPDRPAWSRGYLALVARSEEAVHALLERARAGGGDAAGRKLGAFYGACMDEGAIEAAGPRPVAPLLEVVRGVHDAESLAAAAGELHRHGMFALFEIWDDQDARDMTRTILTLDQGGLGLPDRDDYADPDAAPLRARYRRHVARMFELAGRPRAEAEAAADRALRVETALARAARPEVERRDPKVMYHKIGRAGLARAAPHFAWGAYFERLGLPRADELNVTSVAYFEALDALARDADPAAWRAYLGWTVLRHAAPLLARDFADEAFLMRASITGQKEAPPRWRTCVAATNQALGELVGERFADGHLSPAARAGAGRLVEALREAFARGARELAWLDEPTRRQALAKLATVRALVGRPAGARAYDFEVKPGAYAENVLAARAFEQRRKLAKAGRPVDRDEWQTPPQNPDAYYQPQLNQLVLTAGILQPPFYDERAGVAVNFGAIGSLAGHELTHAFDDTGADYDAAGNLRNWWSDGAAREFRTRTRCVADQYREYDVLPGLKLDAERTLGENLADNGGVKLAFRAYRGARAGARDATVADGFDEDQQFFLSYAQAWCMNQSDEYARLRARVDSHAPSRWRVNGPLANLPAFADAFRCRVGAPMRRANACSLW